MQDFRGTTRFRIVRRLGAGGMGEVYEAHDRQRDLRVALKTIRQVTAASLLRFKSEFRAIHELEHPNLVRLGELLEEEGSWFFTMELVDGVDLLRYVGDTAPRDLPESTISGRTTEIADRPGPGARFDDPPEGPHQIPAAPIAPPFDERKLRSAMAQLARGVHTLHEAGKLHRDIKPSNILVTRGERLVLLDFGLVSGAGADLDLTAAQAIGTAAYMAPEQAEARELTPATDWYSVGVVLYEALTGRLPFSGPATTALLEKRERPPIAPSSIVADLPRDLDELCTALLHPDWRARPRAEEILRRLDVAAPALPSVESSPQTSQQPPFIGRDRELELLRDAHAESGRGAASIVFVEGESGIGKTELVRRFVRKLSERHPEVVVLEGRCYERESVPYKALDGTIDALSRYLSRLPRESAAALMPVRANLLHRLFPVLYRVPAIAQAPLMDTERLDPQEVRRRMFEALRDLFIGLLMRNPLVLVIDDFHWADADSLTLLREILCPPDAPELFLLATIRSDAVGQDWSESIVAPGVHTRRLQLGALSRDSAEDLIRILSPALSAAQASLVVDESRGHPLFIQEILRHVAKHGGEAESLNLDEALRLRVGRLPSSGRRLVELLAVAATPLSQEVARIASGQLPAEFENTVSTVRTLHLAKTSKSASGDTIEIYHDRVRESILGRLGDSNRRMRHAAIASALEQTQIGSADPHAILRHLVAAGRQEHAAACAESAAQLAVDAMAFDQAAELYSTALRLGDPSPEQGRALRIKLGRALANAGRGPEAGDAFLEAARGAPAEARLDCQRLAGEQYLLSGHVERGLDALQTVLAEVGQGLAPTPTRALIAAATTRALLRLRGLGWREVPESAIAPRTLLRLDVYTIVATGLGTMDHIRGLDHQGRCLLLALKTGERTRVARALLREAMYASSGGRTGRERARKLIARGRVIAEADDDPSLHAWVSIAEGFFCYFAGRFGAATQHLSAAATQFRDHCTGAAFELSSARLFLLFALRHEGAFARLRALFDEYLRDALRRGDRYTETMMKVATNCMWLLADDCRGLRHELENLQWMRREEAFHVQHFYELRARGELALYQGSAGQALHDLQDTFDGLARSFLRRVQMIRTESRQTRARLLVAAAGVGDTERGSALAEASRLCRTLDREKIGYARVNSCLVKAAVAHQSDRPELAGELLNDASRQAEDHEMSFHRAAARHRLGELLGGSQGAALLDESRAWLAAEGVANAERMLEVVAPGFGE